LGAAACSTWRLWPPRCGPSWWWCHWCWGGNYWMDKSCAYKAGRSAICYLMCDAGTSSSYVLDRSFFKLYCITTQYGHGKGPLPWRVGLKETLLFLPLPMFVLGRP
jgi:hypothetical protein